MKKNKQNNFLNIICRSYQRFYNMKGGIRGSTLIRINRENYHRSHNFIGVLLNISIVESKSKVNIPRVRYLNSLMGMWRGIKNYKVKNLAYKLDKRLGYFLYSILNSFGCIGRRKY